jgi:phosphatidate cytidylyltransferase
MTSSPPDRRFDWTNLAVRAASATLLIPAVLGAIWYGGGPFLLMIAIAIGLMAVEWGKMSTPEAPAEIAVTITVAVLAAVFAAQVGWYRSAWALMIGGALIAAFITRHKVERAADAAYGVIYIAPACIALVWLRNPSGETFSWSMSQGVAWMLLLFVVTWAADIFAFLVGSVLLRGSGRGGGGGGRLHGPDPAGHRMVRCRPRRAAGRSGDHGRGPLGIDAQAPVRGKGLRGPDPGARRAA